MKNQTFEEILIDVIRAEQIKERNDQFFNAAVVLMFIFALAAIIFLP